LLNPGLLSRAVLFKAMVPLVPEILPLIPRTPVLISNGKGDRLIPPEQTDRLLLLLTSGHGLTREDIRTARKWLLG
jgi:phospholipase/carboxylesterase